MAKNVTDTRPAVKTSTRVLRGHDVEDVKGTETVSNLLSEFEAIREGKSMLTLHFTTNSSVREDKVPARVALVDVYSVISATDRRILEAAAAIKELHKEAIKAAARKRIGNGTRAVWQSVIQVRSK
jgi:hypothetical protein